MWRGGGGGRIIYSTWWFPVVVNGDGRGHFQGWLLRRGLTAFSAAGCALQGSREEAGTPRSFSTSSLLDCSKHSFCFRAFRMLLRQSAHTTSEHSKFSPLQLLAIQLRRPTSCVCPLPYSIAMTGEIASFTQCANDSHIIFTSTINLLHVASAVQLTSRISRCKVIIHQHLMHTNDIC